jgi:hypothetical protein
MGAILHRQQMRRQFGLVERSAQGFTNDDRNWLRSQGIDPRTLPRKSLWYRPDGSSSIAPSDPYHLGLYRQRGMTLKAPVFKGTHLDVLRFHHSLFDCSFAASAS